jgi:hypothetical protein
MRRPTIAYMDNGLPVQCLSERDFLFPDADEKYVPDTRAYIQSYDVPAFHALLRAGSPEDAVAAFPYLSDREKTFALRGLFENWTKELAGVHRRPRYGTSMPGSGGRPPHQELCTLLIFGGDWVI